MNGRIYSVGYEGWTQRGLLENLQQNHVDLLIDVRLSPVSRRPGFSRRQLEVALSEVGIEYRHEPKLGNPPANRERFRSPKKLQTGQRVMRRRLENGSRDAVDALIQDARKRRVALLCVERAAAACHRSVITDLVIETDPTIRIVQVL
jgi:uncharacterized protein (DUF488 family)